MKNWRYYVVSAPEKFEKYPKHIAVFPLPHLLRISFQTADSSSPQAKMPSPSPEPKDALQLVFSTQTVTLKGKDLYPLACTLAELSADSAGDQQIEIPGAGQTGVEVEFD